MRVRLWFVVLIMLGATGCTDIETVYAATVRGFGRFLEVVRAVHLQPKLERPHRDMIAFFEGGGSDLIDGLDALAGLRHDDSLRFWQLFEGNRADIIAVFRRMDGIDKRERLLLAAFTRVFAPREEKFEMARYGWDREMLKTWMDLLVRESRAALR